ncbi:kelch domain-containing protein 1-like [Chanos chanos]|uniref:Kelch domain-containing protein 1-like n=1 Tax=Chanos chanos TaxID=29144 RepID=A0A6J2VGG3_CHACN|nr:kelch domain-containing protein 1-like [Chanos chanos]
MTGVIESDRLAAVQRSDHIAFMEGSVLYVWGGCQSVNGEEIFLPSEEIWLYDLDSGSWACKVMGGEIPPLLSQACGSYLQGMLYIFGGCDNNGHTNQMYCVDIMDGEYTWRRVTNALGTTPSPRDKHSCWIHRNRLIYFGGYGCKTMRDVNNSKGFIVDETYWTTTGTALYQLWGWNNEVHMFEPESVTWTEPETQGCPPTPRSSHASATLGNKGYICGGLETESLNIHCLDFETWTWTQVDPLAGPLPAGRSLHTLTPVSDSGLFLFGGLSMTGQALNDGWEFDTLTREWRERAHAHKDKPRLWHSAAQGRDNEVVVFGGTRDFVLLIDSIAVLRAPSQNHCGDVLVFQMQPYSLIRLCEDCIGKHASLLGEQVSWLPPKLQARIHKRISYFRTSVRKQEKENLI